MLKHALVIKLIIDPFSAETGMIKAIERLDNGSETSSEKGLRNNLKGSETSSESVSDILLNPVQAPRAHVYRQQQHA